MPRIFCCRKMQLYKFCLISILLIFLYVFSILTRFLKRFAWQNILMVQINKKFLISRIYLQLPISYLVIFETDTSQRYIEKRIQALKKTSLNRLSIDHLNCNSLVAYNFIKVALLKAYLSFYRFEIFYISETYLFPSSSITEDDDSTNTWIWFKQI